MELEKYQVFISSPFRECLEQRKCAVQAVINWGHIPIALQNFHRSDQKDFGVMRKVMKDCEIYILILGHTYGSIIKNNEISEGREISYRQFEFEMAIEMGLEPLVFIKNYNEVCEEIMNDKDIIDKRMEMDRIKKLYDLISSRHFYTIWDKYTNFEEVCGRVLTRAIAEKRIRLPGWIRSMEGNNIKKEQMTPIAAEFGQVNPPYRCRDFQENENLCFLLMPFSEDWSDHVWAIIREVAKKCNLECQRADDRQGRFVMEDVWERICRSRFIIADISGGNPNVTYEVGLADSLGKNIILLCQTPQVPFDFAGQRLLLYKNTIEGGINLSKELEKKLRHGFNKNR